MTATATDTDTETIERLDFRPRCSLQADGVSCGHTAAFYIEYHDCRAEPKTADALTDDLACTCCLAEIRTQFEHLTPVRCVLCRRQFARFCDLMPVVRPLRGER